MKKIFTIIYSIIITLVFAGAIGYFGYGLYSEFEHGALRTQRRIDTLEQNITNIPDNIAPGTIEFRDKMFLAIENLNDFASLRIQNKSNILFNYPENYSTSTNEKKSSLINTFEKNINKNGKSIYIKASLYVLRPATIFKYARLSFLIILAGTILTLIILIINNLTKKSNSNYSKVEYIEPEQEEHIQKTETTDEIEKEEEIITDKDISNTTVDSELSDNSDETIESDTTDESFITNDDITEQANVTDNEENDSYKPEIIREDTIITEKPELPNSEEIPASIETNEPSGLFSPVTGFGWQNYLETRLTNELNRATASENDLSLFIIKIPALLDCSEFTLNKICKTIHSLYQFQDLIFEYSDDCFAALKINTTVDEAIIFGEKVVNELKEILPEGHKECFIGISSRSIRMVEARTILHESQAALNHAVENVNPPVIAFRADATKYRRYMELD